MSTALAKPFTPTRTWWKSATIYQIYPISFFDSNGDGIGDLPGIYSKLDYIKDLGVDVIWLCPIYASPLKDMGYDISDYTMIDPRYGTLDDWDRLLAGVHDRGMKLLYVPFFLLMDLVANHTSDEHEWFKQSRSSADNPKRDWYIWRPPRYDKEGKRRPPNNWKSIFQGSAWEYDPPTEEYYLHLFVKEQPDLNWDNPEVREGVYETMRFWLKRGCDGFRMDVINMISKVEGLPDAVVTEPMEEFQPAGLLYVDGPKQHVYLKEMYDKVLRHHDIMTVGETPLTHNIDSITSYVLPGNNELNMVFVFEIMDIDSGGVEGGAEAVSPLVHREWKLLEWKNITEKWQKVKREEGFWNALFLENHDHARSVTRYGNDSPQWRTPSAKLLALYHTTLSGTVYVYQGQELGLKNFGREWGLEEYKDVATGNFWKQELERRQNEQGKMDVDMEDVLDGFQRKARDHARTPMQWDSTAHAGFTTGTPWMRVNDDYTEGWNVEAENADSDSVLSFWKKAIHARKKNEVLIYGDFKLLLREHPTVFAYKRTLEGVTATVLLNFGTDLVDLDLTSADLGLESANVVLATYSDFVFDGTTRKLRLRGYEGVLFVQ
ncbi:glycoside hydrolase family 13 protein [Irpex rosettiformis]|uniref:Glycoside hydrolase family 13 protein n=1 Tax=Irpex rosettiformis TaxID=378272 RepID=A0ACB8TPF5_9APHY|nr:glycoside hydrolase family 13 protein [Irpex rosettiformis]